MEVEGREPGANEEGRLGWLLHCYKGFGVEVQSTCLNESLSFCGSVWVVLLISKDTEFLLEAGAEKCLGFES